MGPAEAKLATQVGSRGYFGKVVLEAEPADQEGDVTVDFDPDQASRWRTGALFGIDYVLEHTAKKKVFPRGGRVHVQYIGGHDADTNNVVIAFVAANALLKALSVEPSKRPEFDEETGVFYFPK